MRVFFRLFGGPVLAVSLAVAGAVEVQAHSEYDRSEPAAGATVAAAPASVQVWFTETLRSRGSTLEVVNERGDRVDNGDARVDTSDPDRKRMVVTLRSDLSPGVYTVRWQTVSADDGDEAEGRFAFGIAVPVPAATAGGPSGQLGQQFDVSGTVTDQVGGTLTLLTTDVSGSAQPIQVDVSRLRKKLSARVGDSLALTVATRPGDPYLALAVISQGSSVDREDFGAREEFTTSNASARAGNRPDDDEARAKRGENKKGKGNE
ncbi:MAG TPA: copper resistance protein CopC [Chloroflexota bacterium]|nr:copper resistance protein CopC [Chloroflexota bacterium]